MLLLDFCRWLQVFTSIHLFSPWVGVNFLRRLFGQDLLQKPHEQRKVLFRAYLARSAGRLPVAPFFSLLRGLKLSQTFERPCTNPTARQRELKGRNEGGWGRGRGELDCREYLTGRLLLAFEGDLPIRVRLLELLDDLAGFDQREKDGVDQLVALC